MNQTTLPAALEAGTSQRILILGDAGDAAVQAIEFLEDLGLEPAIIDAPSVDQLESLRDAAFALVLPSEQVESGAMMLAIGFMLAALGRSRICLLAGAGQTVPAPLEGSLRVTPDDSGIWRLLLGRELKRAGLDVDLNRAL
jgi:hypothetical protein